MSASRFTEAEVGKLWRAALVSSGGAHLSAAQLGKRMAIPIEQARWIVTTMIEIAAYDPATRRLDTSRLPPMRWRSFTPEAFDAYLRELSGGNH